MLYYYNLTHSKKAIIRLMYRPSVNNINIDIKSFDQIIKISNWYKNVISGDFNLPVTSWGYSLKSHMDHDVYGNLLEWLK